MSGSLHRWLFSVLLAVSLSVDACKLSDEFMACPIARDLPSDRLGCRKDAKNRAMVACPKDDHSCLVILNANNTAKVQTLEEGLCIRNSDNDIARVFEKNGKYNETQYGKSYFQWENPCFMGDEEYLVESNHARLRETKVCCSEKCAKKDPADWAKDMRVVWMTFVGGAFTGIFAFVLTFSGTYEMYKKRKATQLVHRDSPPKKGSH